MPCVAPTELGRVLDYTDRFYLQSTLMSLQSSAASLDAYLVSRQHVLAYEADEHLGIAMRAVQFLLNAMTDREKKYWQNRRASFRKSYRRWTKRGGKRMPPKKGQTLRRSASDGPQNKDAALLPACVITGIADAEAKKDDAEANGGDAAATEMKAQQRRSAIAKRWVLHLRERFG